MDRCFTINKNVGVLYANKKSNNELTKLIDSTELSNKYRIKKIFFESISNSTHGYAHTQFENLTRKIHAFLHLSLIWKNRESTLNFKMKAYNMFGNQLQVKNHSSFMIYEKLKMNSTKRIVVKIFGTSLGINLLNYLVLFLFKIKHYFEPDLLKDLDCLLVMHGGRICFEQDYLVWLARLNYIKTIAIQENWDNLSSKSILYQHPDFFATWGKQSTSHLEKFHNFQGTTHEIGSRRLNVFFNYRKMLLEQRKNLNACVIEDNSAKKLLLIGSGDNRHDFTIARECMRIIDQHAKLFRSEFSIVYRPHPHSSGLEEMCQRLKTIAGVSIDKPSAYEDDSYRLNLILNSSLTISLYSTMLLESCILNKLCMIPSFIMNTWNFQTSKFLDTAEHYLGMSALDGLLNPESYEEFVEILMKIDKNDYHPVNNKNSIEWFCSDVDSIKSLSNLIDSSFLAR